MKRFCFNSLILTIALFIFPAQAMPQDSFIFGIQANPSAIEILGETGFDVEPSTFYLGANGLYYEDKYAMASMHAMVGNVIQHGFTGKLGFKSFYGEFDRSVHDDPRLLSLAFSISGEYDLSEVIASHYVPVVLHATLSYSPKPLSFEDSEQSFEGILAADWMFLENAAITATFRYLDIDFDHWDRTHGSGYLGFKFIF